MRNKNIHLIPKDKPSKLINLDNQFNLNLLLNSTIDKRCVNIYITSDEEIKEGDWFLDGNNQISHSYRLSHVKFANPKKIILTTDQNLITNGVQAIDNTFLEWFVKNPSCEWVEVEKIKNYKGNYLDCFHTQGQCDCGLNLCKQMFFTYKIILPKGEPKQGNFYEDLVKYFETTPREKVLEDWNKSAHLDNVGPTVDEFLENTNKQQERMYSEEDMLEASKYGYNFHKTTQFPEQDFEDSCIRNTKQWLKQFKKK